MKITTNYTTGKQPVNNTNFGLLNMDTPGLARKIGGELGEIVAKSAESVRSHLEEQTDGAKGTVELGWRLCKKGLQRVLKVVVAEEVPPIVPSRKPIIGRVITRLKRGAQSFVTISSGEHIVPLGDGRIEADLLQKTKNARAEYETWLAYFRGI